MKKQFYYILLFVILTINNAIAISKNNYNSGFEQLTILDKNRNISLAIWYPTSEIGPKVTIGDNAIFISEKSIVNAKMAKGKYPLIIISHGLGGSWLNQAWLANTLSQQGYIVAAPNHPGTSSDNMVRSIAQNMLERPHDINRIITFLLSHSKYTQNIKHDNIIIIGHSYGGWTALEAIGAQFSSHKFREKCQSYPFSASCIIFNKQMQGLEPNSDYFKLEKKMKDSRIHAAIVFDISFAHGFTIKSLKSIDIPLLIIEAKSSEDDNSKDSESLYLFNNLPIKTTEYMAINDATHFSFIGICKNNAITSLKKQSYNETLICQDGAKDRHSIHQQLINKIINWLESYNIK